MDRPTKATTAGQAFLALRGKALSACRTTAEYLRLYALEGFLLRLANSSHRNRFVLKGGVLLAAYELRRPTADGGPGGYSRRRAQVESVRKLVADVAATATARSAWTTGSPSTSNDVRAETIREGEAYGGVRVRLVARLATAREPFHVDVYVGDPIWPAPADVALPAAARTPRRYACAATRRRWCWRRRSSPRSSAARRTPAGATSVTSIDSPGVMRSVRATSARPANRCRVPRRRALEH